MSNLIFNITKEVFYLINSHLEKTNKKQVRNTLKNSLLLLMTDKVTSLKRYLVTIANFLQNWILKANYKILKFPKPPQ